MASVDGYRSLQGACDEIFDIFCGPCKSEKVIKEAKSYCADCMEYLCNDCKEAHLKFKMSRHHKILSGNAMPTSVTANQRPSFFVYCSCNQNQAVSVYCEKHEEVICQSCRTVKHRNCKLVSIQEKSINYNSARFTSFVASAKALKDKIEKLKQKRKADQCELATLKDGCKKDLANLRKEMDTFFDTLEQDMLQGFDQSAREQEVIIDKHITSLDTTLQMLKADCKLLDDANQGGDKDTMFASEIKVSKGLEEYDGLIAELQKDITRPILSFTKNKKINKMYTEIHTLGSVKCNNVVMGMTVKSSHQVHVKLPNVDSNTPIITACCFMPNKYTVFSDRANVSIKLMDDSLKYRGRVKLRTGPGDVSVVDDNNVIVTLPEIKQLQFVQIFPKLEAGRVIQLDKSCFGVFVSEDEIFTSCHNNPGQGEVQIFDLDGVRKRNIGDSLDGQYMLKSPNFLVVSKSSKRIFLSDDVTSTVTCMSLEGDIIYQCKDSELKGLAGLYVDAHDNAVVCDTDSARVISITQNGRQYGDLVSSTDGLSQPYSIAYRDWDNTLLVGCYYKNNVFCFKLE